MLPDKYRQSPVENHRPHDYADKDLKGSREHLDSLESESRRNRDNHNKTPVSNHIHSDNTQPRHSGTGHRRERIGSTSKDRRSPPVMETNSHDISGSRKDMDNYEKSSRSPNGSRHHIRIDRVGDSPTHVSNDNPDNGLTYNDKKQHLDPSTAETGRTSSRQNRRKLDMLRNDSLSSDPSDCARPPPPKPHKNRRGKQKRQHSFSSSDDEIRSTPECSSCEEQDQESESIISEKGDILLSNLHKKCYFNIYNEFSLTKKQPRTFFKKGDNYPFNKYGVNI